MYEATIILAFRDLDGDDAVGTTGLLIVTAFLVSQFMLWFIRGPTQPDPWDEKVAADLESGEGVPVCHRCLVPHDPSVNFCPDCGAPVGTYTNWLPFPYLFSRGHSLRVGTDGSFKCTPFNLFGFVALGFVEYGFFAPVYWFRLHQNVARLAELEARQETGEIEPPAPPPLNGDP